MNVKSALDIEVKTINTLLQQLSIDDRIAYVKGMIPCLLPVPQQITSGSQRLAEKHVTPFNNLSETQRELIAELTNKTDALFKVMSEEN